MAISRTSRLRLSERAWRWRLLDGPDLSHLTAYAHS
jgi:hypothetical protein